MQLIEETSERLTYRYTGKRDDLVIYGLPPKRTTWLTRDIVDPSGSTIVSGYSEYSCLQIMAAFGIVLMLIIAPSLSYSLNSLILGSLIAWIVAVIWMTRRETWKGQVREHRFIIDKQAKQLIQQYKFNDGHTHAMTYNADQINAVIPHDFTHSHWITLDYASQQYGRQRLTLEQFPTQAERDAALQAVRAGLDLPIPTQNEASAKGL